MKLIYQLCLVTSVLFTACASKKKVGLPVEAAISPHSSTSSEVELWLTKGDQSQLLTKQNTTLNFSTTTNSNPTIEVDSSTKFQSIDGFGYTLTGGSASLINALPAAEKDKLLNELLQIKQMRSG